MKVLTYFFKLFASYTLCGMCTYPFNSKFSNFAMCFVTFPGTLLEQVTSRALKVLVLLGKQYKLVAICCF